jgi:hypothetical protein
MTVLYVDIVIQCGKHRDIQMNYGDMPPSRDEMIEAIVGEVKYWDLETLIGWAEDEMRINLSELNFEELHSEYMFCFEED